MLQRAVLLGRLVPAASRVNLCALLKGDAVGNEFHGNQWTTVSTNPPDAYGVKRAVYQNKTGDRITVVHSRHSESMHRGSSLSGYSRVTYNARGNTSFLTPTNEKTFKGEDHSEKAAKFLSRFGIRHDAGKLKELGKVDLGQLTKDWDESLHPRDDNGRFGEGTGGISKEGGVWVRNGQPLPAADQARLKAMGVPPAWTKVELNPDLEGNLQVVGKDSKGRDQYIYSVAHSERQAAEKFERAKAFNEVAPKVREQAQKDMGNSALSERERDTAAATLLIAETGFRIGSTDDTGATIKAFGATTLLGSHVKVTGDTVKFSFTGKKGVEIEKELRHSALAKYLGDKSTSGPLFKTTDESVRAYFKSKAGDAFKVKDFRTWHATLLAIKEVMLPPPPTNQKEFAAKRMGVARKVAAFLGNTPTVALASYIDPSVFHIWPKT